MNWEQIIEEEILREAEYQNNLPALLDQRNILVEKCDSHGLPLRGPLISVSGKRRDRPRSEGGTRFQCLICAKIGISTRICCTETCEICLENYPAGQACYVCACIDANLALKSEGEDHCESAEYNDEGDCQCSHCRENNPAIRAFAFESAVLAREAQRDNGNRRIIAAPPSSEEQLAIALLKMNNFYYAPF